MMLPLKQPWKLALVACAMLTLSLGSAVIAADEPVAQPETVTYQVLGLFSPERVADLQEAAQKLTDISLVSVDYDNAEANLRFDRAKLFKGVKPEEVVKRIDNQLRQASHNTFSLKERRTIPLSDLTKVEIGVIGIDCKGCCLAAYESVYKLDGVELVTVSFKEGRLVAYIDEKKTARAALEAALKKRNIPVVAPAETPGK